MIKYYKVENGRLASVSDIERAEIVRLIAPTSAELENVSSLASVPMDFLSAACDEDERPRLESEDGIHLLVLRVPHKNKNNDIPVITIAFGLVLTNGRIISVCSVESPVWETFNASKSQIPTVDAPVVFVCRVLLCIANLYLKHLNFIQSEANRVEREIHHSMRNEMLIRMLNLEKCLVYFTTSLRGYDPLWSRLRRIKDGDLTEPEKELIDEVQIEFKQAHDLAEIHSNILSGMMDAFASVISNNLNIVMKLLTSITIILMLPTFIASVYGMNVKLPFQNSPHAFAITIIMSLILSATGVILFWKKKYF